MQSVLKLMPEPIPEVPREAPRDAGTSTSSDYGNQDRHSSGFSQEFDHQINQYNDRNGQGGANQQAQADFPDENGNQQKDERQQMTADELRELANQSQKDAKGGISADNKPVKEDKGDEGDVKPFDLAKGGAQSPKDSSALDSLVALVEDADKLIRSDKSDMNLYGAKSGSANIDSEFLKRNKLTDAMDHALIGKKGDKRSVEDVLKGFAQSGSSADETVLSEKATQAKQTQDPELAKLLGQIQGSGHKAVGVETANANGVIDEKALANKLMAAGDKLQQGKAGQANLVIPGESESHQDGKSLDLLKILNGQSDAQSKAQAASKAGLQSAEQVTNTDTQSGDEEMSIADLLAGHSAKGKKGDNGDETQTKPMELAGDKDKPIKPMELVGDKDKPIKPMELVGDKDKPIKPMELVGDKDKPIKPMELAGANGANAVDEQSIAADEALKNQQSQSIQEQLSKERLKVDLQQPQSNQSSQTNDTINPQTQDKVAEHLNQQLNAANQAASANVATAQSDAQNTAKSAAQSAAQTIVTGDKRQNILGKNANAKGGNDAQAPVNSEKLAQMSAQELQQNQGEQQFDESQAGSDGLFDEMMQATMPKEAPVASNKMASQFGQTFNQFSNDGAARLNAATQSLSSTGTEKTPPQVTETLHMTRPDLSVNMKERMTLMMKSGIQTADIRLDPAELGQMQVKMSVENDVTSVSFVVQNSQAKELLEKAMPQLKEMLAEQGVEMGESSVSQQDKQQQELGDGEGNGQGQMAGNGQNGEEVEEEAIVQQVNITNGAVGGIDFFA